MFLQTWAMEAWEFGPSGLSNDGTACALMQPELRPRYSAVVAQETFFLRCDLGGSSDMRVRAINPDGLVFDSFDVRPLVR
jgi:hypothetical protein